MEDFNQLLNAHAGNGGSNEQSSNKRSRPWEEGSDEGWVRRGRGRGRGRGGGEDFFERRGRGRGRGSFESRGRSHYSTRGSRRGRGSDSRDRGWRRGRGWSSNWRSSNRESEDFDPSKRFVWDKEKLASVRGKNLAIVPAGDNSLHDDKDFKWHGSDAFDLCIVYYGSNAESKKRFQSHSNFFFEKQGPKWQLVRHVLKNLDWKGYEYIWLPDDDLKMDPVLIASMFRIASEYSILLGQPALFDENVQAQYREVLIQRPDLLLHFSNFVEIMCPFLRVDFLQHVLHTIDSDDCKSGWGLDMLWPTLLNFKHIAVIDATPVRHTRPQNAFSVDNSFYRKYNIDPQRECHELMTRFRFSDYRKCRLGEIPLATQPKEMNEEQKCTGENGNDTVYKQRETEEKKKVE